MVRIPRSCLAACAALVIAVGAAGCGGGDNAVAEGSQTSTTTLPAPTTTTLPAYMSLVATAKVPVVSIYDDPTSAAPSRQLENPWLVDPTEPATAVPQVFLAKETRPDGWVRVLLPLRPNGSSGWVRSTEVSLAPNPYSIRVERGAHQITVTNADAVVYQGAVAVGLPETPTPLGEYYLRVLIQAPDPNQVYGPFAYGLSSHSDVLETFNGGDGEIGIHGNNDASVLGHDASHGCIRMDNAAIAMLSALLPLGTPVEIVA